MNIDFDRTDTQIVFQSLRSLMTVIGLAGAVIVIVESGTGTFFETIDRLAHASQLLAGLAG